MKAFWKGWEYVDKAGIHMVQSSRHVFLSNEKTSVCGQTPKFTPRREEGEWPCKRCLNWLDKHPEYEEV